MQPDNIILGDMDLEIPTPQEETKEDDMAETRRMASFTKTEEWRRIQEWCNEKIAFYQTSLPNGQAVTTDTATLNNWIVANTLIKDLSELKGLYQMANDIVNGEYNLDA